MKKQLLEQRDMLLKEIEALRNKVAGLEMAIAMADGDSSPKSKNAEGRKRQNIKETLFELLREAGTTGLSAATAVEMASRRGKTLNKGSVSSMLSRYKSDGILDFDGTIYRLTEFSNRPSNHDDNIKPFPIATGGK